MASIAIRFGGYQPPTSVHSRAVEVFQQVLSRGVGAQVAWTLEGNIMATGRPAADLLTLVERGELTMCYFSASYLAERVPEFALLDLPFTITDRARAYGLLDGPLGRLLTEKLQAVSGFRLLGFWDNGFRHLSNAVRPLRAPADCQGLRLRTLLSPLHGRVFRLLGFEPVPLDVKDFLAAVSAGTVDAQENPLTTIYNFGVHTQHRYITLSGHFFGAVVLLCHAESYASWPREMQQAVMVAAAEATAAQRQWAATEDAEVLARLDPAQNEVLHLTARERLAFIEAVAPLLAEQRAAFGEHLFAWLTT